MKMSMIYSVNYNGQAGIITVGAERGRFKLLGININILPIYSTLAEPPLSDLDILKWGVLVDSLSNGPKQLFDRVQLLARLLCSE
jgi:hypothetical protein